MSYKNNMRSVALNTMKKLQEIDEKIRDLKSKEVGYYKPTFDDLMKKLKEAREDIIRESREEAEGYLRTYEKDVHELFSLKAEDLTSDSEILKNFDLTVDELNTMLKKYEHNPTMSRLVLQYAEKHNITLSNIPMSEGAYIDNGKTLFSYYESALKTSDYASVFEDDGNFEKISSGILE